MIASPKFGLIRIAGTGAIMFMLALVASSPAMAFGDPERGRDLAERWCSACHIVTVSGPDSATDGAPTFRSIATDPRYGRSRVSHFLKAPHPPMPDFQLSNQIIEDLVAYLETMGLQ
jgi:mono/diheme cytochrome c family protein